MQTGLSLNGWGVLDWVLMPPAEAGQRLWELPWHVSSSVRDDVVQLLARYPQFEDYIEEYHQLNYSQFSATGGLLNSLLVDVRQARAQIR